jgi:hypothetical protein
MIGFLDCVGAVIPRRSPFGKSKTFRRCCILGGKPEKAVSAFENFQP